MLAILNENCCPAVGTPATLIVPSMRPKPCNTKPPAAAHLIHGRAAKTNRSRSDHHHTATSGGEDRGEVSRGICRDNFVALIVGAQTPVAEQD